MDSAQQVRDRGGLRTNEGCLQFRMSRKISPRLRVYAVRRAWLETEIWATEAKLA